MENTKNIIEQYRKNYSALLGSDNTPKLPIPLISEQDTRLRLVATYSLEVENRGRKFDMDDHTDDAINRVARWLYSSPKRGLLLMGTLGNGKSTMMRAIHSVFYHHSSLGDAQEIFDYYKQDRGMRFWDEKLLLIDDLGVEPIRCMNYGEEYHPMSRLLLHRYSSMLTTIIATNLNIDEIQERYGDRVVDRMFETFEVIKYVSDSYRRQ